MATRFYLPTSVVAPISIAGDSSWERDGNSRRGCVTKKVGSAASDFGVANAVAGPSDGLVCQFVSAALAAQTILGTIKGQVLSQEDSGRADYRAQLLVKVVSNDGKTLRGILLAHDTDVLRSEFATSLVNRKFPVAWSLVGATVDTLSIVDGDRLVFEIGARKHDTSTTSRTATLRFGDNGTDLPEDEAATVGDPWIELSHDVVFAGATPPPAGFTGWGIPI